MNSRGREVTLRTAPAGRGAPVPGCLLRNVMNQTPETKVEMLQGGPS